MAYQWFDGACDVESRTVGDSWAMRDLEGGVLAMQGTLSHCSEDMHNEYTDEVSRLETGSSWAEYERLRQENQQLKEENSFFKRVEAGAGVYEANMIDGHVDQGPGLPESQIDRAKLKTKLCKYFMQAQSQAACPFYGRHGWCAFAHGEAELSPTTLVTSPLSPLESSHGF
eukprot:TRINITY_DN11849_c0_g1_i1.p1 TRINITY_DN11849_c0_g1~~TRINITY_DN11849_c0_g1_i1.p1  ORF type:complete len:171 (+),score=30.05 TRINITY_DN11849_c0_g1_i1:53-565(+)